MALTLTASIAAVPAVTPPTPWNPAVGALDGFVRQDPQWKRCGDEFPADFTCATIEVPLDYRAPAGRRIDLAVSRFRSAAPAERRGILLFNPGGPGVAGLEMPFKMRRKLPESVRDKYDLIGMDPRGVGQSSPISCALNHEEETWLRPYKARTFTHDVAWARRVARKCEARSGDKIPHITTSDTARDMDLLRAILGEEKISFVARSYGTYLGAVYTQLFPGRADRFVLDSAVDPTRVWREMIRWWARSAEPAFDRWAVWVAERSETYGLGGTPEAVKRTFWNLVHMADDDPFETEGQPTTGDDIRGRMRTEAVDPQRATEIIVGLRQTAVDRRSTSGWMADGADSEEGWAPSSGILGAEVPSDNATASFWAVMCGDNSAAWPHDPERYQNDAVRDMKQYPLYGDFVSNVKPCAFWQDSKEPAIKVTNNVGALIVQNEWDPQTPLASGLALHAYLKGSSMVTILGGEGHIAYPSGEQCADGAVTTYLLTGTLPQKELTCRAGTSKNLNSQTASPNT
ncbi:alpha/beta hydrolase [Streptomyces sp. NPDC089424]|uniref:alpha/beta hydrolase n=1 Tax=Streptomyces sp. NPDC089424 TaxID=3365917 RepID=UPI00380B3B5D